MKKVKKFKEKRSWWFRGFKACMKLVIKPPKFVYLGEKIKDGSIILSNHVGTKAPLAMELYLNQPLRIWGAYQMNGNVFSVYKYQTKTYYIEKKHWNPFLAYTFCLLASPLTWIFYRGLNLIPTYKDHRFRRTLAESVETIKHNQSVLLFPEDSTKGYLDELEGFYAGFVVLAKTLYKQGIDVPIVVSYYKKEAKEYIIDNPVLYSELLNKYETQEEIAKQLCERTNELFKINAKSDDK